MFLFYTHGDSDTLSEVDTQSAIIVRYNVREWIYTASFVHDIVLAFRVCGRYAVLSSISVFHTRHTAVVGFRVYPPLQYLLLPVIADREEICSSQLPIQMAASPSPKTTHGYIPVAAGSVVLLLIGVNAAHVQ